MNEAKDLKKNDMASKKLKKMEAKAQSLKDKKKSKNQRRKAAGHNPKKALAEKKMKKK